MYKKINYLSQEIRNKIMTMMCVAPFLLPLATLAHLRVGLANFDDDPYEDEDDNELGCCC